MLAALKYRQDILDSFYLDEDDITIRRTRGDKVKGKFKKDEVVTSYIFKGNRGKAYHGIWIPGVGTTIGTHWIVTVLRGITIPEGSVIDHLNGDRLDNSRSNLKVTTQSMNCRNRGKHKNNTSGYTGISFHKPTGRFVVRRTINGKRIWKSHKTLEGAIEILKEVERLGREDGYTERHGK